MLAPTACVTPPRIPAAAESISALAGEPRIVAVHYHDLGTRGPLRDDAGMRSQLDDGATEKAAHPQPKGGRRLGSGQNGKNSQ